MHNYLGFIGYVMLVCAYGGDVTYHICIRMSTVNIREATLCGNWNQGNSKRLRK